MKTRMRFYEEPEDKGGEPSRGTAIFANEPIPPEKPAEGVEEKETPTVEPVVPAPATVDAAALAKSLGSEIASAMKAQQEPTKEKGVDDLTPEEAEKLLHVWKPTKEWIAKFGNLETQEEAVKELRDGLIKHGDTISQYRIREITDKVRKELEGKFAPAVAFMEKYQEDQTMSRLGAAYPQLADEKMRPVLTAVAEDLKKNGKTFDKESELFDALKTGVEAVIQVTNKDFKLSAGSTPAAKPKGQSANAIPVTSPGSGGGVGKSGDSSPAQKRGIAVFGPVPASR